MRIAVCLSLGLGLVVGLSAAGDEIVLREALYSGRLSDRNAKAEARLAVYRDPVFERFVDGTLTPPRSGEVSGPDNRGEVHHWERIEADAEGNFTSPRGWGLHSGYLYFSHDSPQEETVILHAVGAFELLVNGIPRGGDVYGNGRVLLPVKLRAGRNDIWMLAGPRARRQSVRLLRPEKPVFLTELDPTLPTFLTNEVDDKLAAVRVVNATGTPVSDLRLVASAAGVERETRIDQSITPRAVRKFAFTVHDGANAAGPEAVRVRLYQGSTLLDERTFEFDVREPMQNVSRTFVSGIDGSLQYYGERAGTMRPNQTAALIFSVHGAGVQGLAQAGAYRPKDWAHVIAPTNRREYGFDWEDWGRLDALEVLAEAERRHRIDPARVYLTGHSMGGHGTWTLGANYAGRWAAISPMAGWRSFYTYVDLENYDAADPRGAMLNRANNPGRTLELARNHQQHAIFIEHGDADRSVPVEEARGMRALLSTFHPEFAYHEEPDGAHWYGIDHPRAIDYLRAHEQTDLRDLDVLTFRSVTPGISATSRYVTLYQQEHSYAFCGVVARQTIRSRRQRRHDEDLTERTISVATENLAVFRVNLAHCQHLERLALEVDEQAIGEWTDSIPAALWLRKQDGKWALTDEPSDPTQKNPTRYGGFKDAFRHRVVFVYATGGTPEENAAAYHKARFDESTFYNHGNGSIEIIPDTAFSLAAYPGRSVILYGNRDTNRAWSLLLADSPVQVGRGELRVGETVRRGEDLGAYFVRPRPDSEVASVGVVAGTSARGFRTVAPNRYFPPGTGYPDLLVLAPDVFTTGLDGVVAAGYFGNDWSVNAGEFVWRKQP